MALVLDTGILYAALDADDPDHEACATLVAASNERLVIPSPVFGELDYWVRKFASSDAWLAFCHDVSVGAYSIHPLDADVLLRAAQLQARYADLGLGLVDASVFTTCEILGEAKVATLDRRHFAVLRTADGKSLKLLPELSP